MKNLIIDILNRAEKNKVTYKNVFQWVYMVVIIGLMVVSVGDKMRGVEEHEVKANNEIVKIEESGVEKDVTVSGKVEVLDKEVNEPIEEVEEVRSVYILEKGEEKLETNQFSFIKEVIPQAEELAKENGLYTSIMVAQAILESDWGQSELAVEANNLFGIKGSYEGESYQKATLEDDGRGNKYEIVDKFAKYPTTRESLESNANLLAEGLSYDERFYEDVWVENTEDYKESARSLTGTYATDIKYSNKLIEIIEKYRLHELD